MPAFHVHRFYARGPPSPEGMRCGIRAAEIGLCFDDARAIPLIVVPAAKPRADDCACNVRCFVQKKLARKLFEAKRLWVKSKPGIRSTFFLVFCVAITSGSGLQPRLVQIRNQLNITISVFLRLLQQVGAGFSPHNVTGISCRAFARAKARTHVLVRFFLTIRSLRLRSEGFSE